MDRDATRDNASDLDGDMDLDAITDMVALAIALALQAIPVLQPFIFTSFKVHMQLCSTAVYHVARRCSAFALIYTPRKDTNAKAAQVFEGHQATGFFEA